MRPLAVASSQFRPMARLSILRCLAESIGAGPSSLYGAWAEDAVLELPHERAGLFRRSGVRVLSAPLIQVSRSPIRAPHQQWARAEILNAVGRSPLLHFAVSNDSSEQLGLRPRDTAVALSAPPGQSAIALLSSTLGDPPISTETAMLIQGSNFSRVIRAMRRFDRPWTFLDSSLFDSEPAVAVPPPQFLGFLVLP